MNEKMISKPFSTVSKGYLEELAGITKKSKTEIDKVIKDRFGSSVPLSDIEKESINNPPSPISVKFSDLSGYIKKN